MGSCYSSHSHKRTSSPSSRPYHKPNRSSSVSSKKRRSPSVHPRSRSNSQQQQQLQQQQQTDNYSPAQSFSENFYQTQPEEEGPGFSARSPYQLQERVEKERPRRRPSGEEEELSDSGGFEQQQIGSVRTVSGSSMMEQAKKSSGINSSAGGAGAAPGAGNRPSSSSAEVCVEAASAVVKKRSKLPKFGASSKVAPQRLSREILAGKGSSLTGSSTRLDRTIPGPGIGKLATASCTTAAEASSATSLSSNQRILCLGAATKLSHHKSSQSGITKLGSSIVGTAISSSSSSMSSEVSQSSFSTKSSASSTATMKPAANNAARAHQETISSSKPGHHHQVASSIKMRQQQPAVAPRLPVSSSRPQPAPQQSHNNQSALSNGSRRVGANKNQVGQHSLQSESFDARNGNYYNAAPEPASTTAATVRSIEVVGGNDSKTISTRSGGGVGGAGGSVSQVLERVGAAAATQLPASTKFTTQISGLAKPQTAQFIAAAAGAIKRSAERLDGGGAFAAAGHPTTSSGPSYLARYGSGGSSNVSQPAVSHGGHSAVSSAIYQPSQRPQLGVYSRLQVHRAQPAHTSTVSSSTSGHYSGPHVPPPFSYRPANFGFTANGSKEVNCPYRRPLGNPGLGTIGVPYHHGNKNLGQRPATIGWDSNSPITAGVAPKPLPRQTVQRMPPGTLCDPSARGTRPTTAPSNSNHHDNSGSNNSNDTASYESFCDSYSLTTTRRNLTCDNYRGDADNVEFDSNSNPVTVVHQQRTFAVAEPIPIPEPLKLTNLRKPFSDVPDSAHHVSSAARPSTSPASLGTDEAAATSATEATEIGVLNSFEQLKNCYDLKSHYRDPLPSMLSSSGDSTPHVLMSPEKRSPKRQGSAGSNSGTDVDRDFLIDDDYGDQQELFITSTGSQSLVASTVQTEASVASGPPEKTLEKSLSELENLKAKQNPISPEHCSLSRSSSMNSSVSHSAATAVVSNGDGDGGTTPTTPVATTRPAATTRFRKPRALSLIESPEGSLGFDGTSYRALMQDMHGVKLLLFRLQGLLQNAETLNPFDHQSKSATFQNLTSDEQFVNGFASSLMVDQDSAARDVNLRQENLDLKRQMVLMQQQLEDKDKTIKLLQNQMTKYLNIDDSGSGNGHHHQQQSSSGCGQESRPERVATAATQTDRGAQCCAASQGISPRNLSDGSNGMLVSPCDTYCDRCEKILIFGESEC